MFLTRLSSPLLSAASTLLRPFPALLPLAAAAQPQINMPLHTTAPVEALPGKKKKRLDPQVFKAREEKRMRRLRKALRKMEKKQRIPRPLIEHEVPPHIMRELETRDRGTNVLEAVAEERALLFKDWNRYCYRRAKAEVYALDSIILSQYRALEELRAESEELYLEAIQFDHELIPFKGEGPAQTPPIPEYIQDGVYHDVTKKFQVKYGDMKEFLMKLTLNHRRKKKKAVEEDE